MKILYVEDVPEQAIIVTTLLEIAGLNASISHVETLRDALAELGKSHFDLVLLDLGLPDGSGVELVRRVNKTAPASPIVVLTSKEGPRLGVDCLEAGAQDFLSKLNLTPDRLGDCLLHAVARKKEAAMSLGDVLSRLKPLHSSNFAGVSDELFQSYEDLLAKPEDLYGDEHWKLGAKLADEGISAKQVLAVHEASLRSLCATFPMQQRARILASSEQFAMGTLSFMTDAYQALSIKASARALSARAKKRRNKTPEHC